MFCNWDGVDLLVRGLLSLCYIFLRKWKFIWLRIVLFCTVQSNFIFKWEYGGMLKSTTSLFCLRTKYFYVFKLFLTLMSISGWRCSYFVCWAFIGTFLTSGIFRLFLLQFHCEPVAGHKAWFVLLFLLTRINIDKHLSLRPFVVFISQISSVTVTSAMVSLPLPTQANS